MRTIYVDPEFKCHVADDGSMTAVETDAFDGKCNVYIEGFRYIPAGERWERSDGAVFTGEMAAPWKPYPELIAAQRAYEKETLVECVTLVDELCAESGQVTDMADKITAARQAYTEKASKAADLDTILAQFDKMPFAQFGALLSDTVLAVLRKYGYADD